MSPLFAMALTTFSSSGQDTLMSHFSKVTVEIITSVSVSPDPSAQLSTKNRIRSTNAQRILDVERTIIAPATGKVFMRDFARSFAKTMSNCGTRGFYETNIGVLKVDPGADILNPRNGRFKRVYLDHADRHHTDLSSIYNLPRIVYKQDGNLGRSAP